MQRSSPMMMFTCQQMLQLKPKLPKPTQVNAEWPDMPVSSVIMDEPDKALRRGAIFRNNCNCNEITESLLVQLATMDISRRSSSLSQKAALHQHGSSKAVEKSAVSSPHRTLSKSRVHSRRKNRVAIVDNKIMMKTHQPGSSSRMSFLLFTSLDMLVGSSSDMSVACM